MSLEAFTPAPEYSDAIIGERQEVIARWREAQKDETRPLISAFLYDQRGTTYCEQAISVDSNSTEPVIGYHIVDATVIDEDSHVDALGFENRKDSSNHVRLAPLFGDRILHQNLNFNPKHKAGEAVPAISFFYRPSRKGCGLQLVDIVKTRVLVGQVYVYDSEAPEPFTPSDELLAFQNIISDHMPLYGKSVKKSEQGLADTSANYAQMICEDAGLRLFSDMDKRIAINRPMRSWADFKNLHLLASTLEINQQLLISQQHDKIQAHIHGQVADSSELGIKPEVKTLQDLLSHADAEKVELSPQTFAELVDFIDGSVFHDSRFASSLVRWATSHGYIQEIEEVIQLPQGTKELRIRLHNTSQPIRVPYDTEADRHEATSGVLIGFLQRHKIVSSGRKGIAQARGLLQDQFISAAMYSKKEHQANARMGSRMKQTTGQATIHRKRSKRR